MLDVNINKVLLLQAKKCLTNTQLAKDAGITRQTLANMMSGRHKASIVSIGKIAAALSVEVKEILEITI